MTYRLQVIRTIDSHPRREEMIKTTTDGSTGTAGGGGDEQTSFFFVMSCDLSCKSSTNVPIAYSNVEKIVEVAEAAMPGSTQGSEVLDPLK